MNDAELIEEFFEIERAKEAIRILVQKISWDGPHTPVSNWSEAKVLPPEASEESIQQSITELLNDPQYFGMCTECNERNPNGWMQGRSLCQSCAEKNHGIVY